MLNGQARLDRWHDFIETRDFSILDDFLSKDVLFHTPVYLKPRRGKDVTSFLLTNVLSIFEDFTYHRELTDDQNWALEFSARIGDRLVKGIDLIRFDDQGLMVDFEVYVRPANGLEALGKHMFERIQAAGMLETFGGSGEPTE